MSFRVGQQIICIDADPPKIACWTGAWLVKNRIYTVREIGLKTALGNNPALRLHEVCFSKSDHTFNVRRFRPLITKSTDTGMSILRKLQDPANHKILEGA